MCNKKYAYFLAVLFLALCCLYVYKYNQNCVSNNYGADEHMINIPKTENPKWNRNSCNYQMSNTVVRVLNDFKLNEAEKSEKYDFVFPCGYDEIKKEIASIGEVKSNGKYFILSDADQLIAKDLLWKHLASHYGLEKAKMIMPHTYILYNEHDKKRFVDEYDPKKIYIMKKNIQRQEGLKITNNKDEIVKGFDQHYVVAQELLQDPYTITDNINNTPNHRKINMRFYILTVCRGGEMNVFVHKNGFMYYTKTSFKKGSLDTDPNITTGYIDREVYSVSPLTHDDFRTYLDSNRDASEYEIHVRGQGLRLSNVVFDRIYNLLRDVFVSIVGKICTKGKLSDAISFQLFGADIALNEKLQPMIMEVNKGPDLGSKDKRDGDVKYKVISDIFRVMKLINDGEEADFIPILDVSNSGTIQGNNIKCDA